MTKLPVLSIAPGVNSAFLGQSERMTPACCQRFNFPFCTYLLRQWVRRCGFRAYLVEVVLTPAINFSALRQKETVIVASPNLFYLSIYLFLEHLNTWKYIISFKDPSVFRTSPGKKPYSPIKSLIFPINPRMNMLNIWVKKLALHFFWFGCIVKNWYLRVIEIICWLFSRVEFS